MSVKNHNQFIQSLLCKKQTRELKMWLSDDETPDELMDCESTRAKCADLFLLHADDEHEKGIFRWRLMLQKVNNQAITQTHIPLSSAVI